MTPRQLKHVAAQQAVQANIVSDGCRDYVIEVLSQTGAGLLRHRRGMPLKFRNLGEAHRVLKRCGVQKTVLKQRIADDEACFAGMPPRFHELTVALRR